MEHFASAADGWVFFPTYLGNLGRQQVLSRSDQDGGGSQADPPQKRTGPAFTSSCVLSTPRKTALDVSGGDGGGRELLWMRSGRCRRWAHPWTKRGESGSADQLQKSHRAAARVVIPQIATTTVIRWPRVSIKSPQLSTEHCTCLLTLALSQPLAARSFSSSKSITSRYCGTRCHPM